MNSTPNTAARPVRVSRTRQALLEAAKRLITSGRMGSAAIDDIVREADVAKGSFFNHFSDKHELSAQVLQAVRADLEEAIDAANASVDEPAARMVRGLLVSYRYGMDNQVGARVLLHDSHESRAAAQAYPALFRDLQVGMASGALTPDSIDAGVTLVLGLSNLGLSRLLDMRLDFDQARSLMRDLCLAQLRGLGVPARQQARIVDEALAAVIDEPRRRRCSS